MLKGGGVALWPARHPYAPVRHPRHRRQRVRRPGGRGVLVRRERLSISGRALRSRFAAGRNASVDIHDNVFPHEGLEDDWGDDAIHVEDRDDLDVIAARAQQRHRCRLVRTLWRLRLRRRRHRRSVSRDRPDLVVFELRRVPVVLSQRPDRALGSGPARVLSTTIKRCDVLTESDGEWVIASGGTGPWQSIGAFEAPLERSRVRPVRSQRPRPSAGRDAAHDARLLAHAERPVAGDAAVGPRLAGGRKARHSH